MKLNLDALMKKAKEIQIGVKEAQKNLDTKTVSVETGGGLVKIVMNCRNQLKKLSISPDIFEGTTTVDEKFKEKIDFLTELLISAFNQAVRSTEEESQKTLLDATQDLNLESLEKYSTEGDD